VLWHRRLSSGGRVGGISDGMKRSEKQIAASLRHLAKAHCAQRQKRITLKCQYCQNKFDAPQCFTRKRFCSWDCRVAGMRGSSAANWKGGIDNSKRKESHQSYVWRKTVLARSHCCEWCYAKPPLQAHHLLRYSLFPELRFDPKNGVALCKSCHHRAHKPTIGRVSGNLLFPFANA
jgi:5-methylcytosine-specific restriction endonuclease McrA